MSHADKVSKPPPDFHVIGYTDLPLTPLLRTTQNLYDIPFHLEVTHTPDEKSVIGNFILDIYADVDDGKC